MSRAPFVLPKAETAFSRHAEIHDTTIGWRFVNPLMKAQYGVDSMPETGENVAEDFAINRADQDAFALESQTRAAAAQEGGHFADELVSVEVPSRKGPVTFDRDEYPRATTAEALAKPAPALYGAGMTARIIDGKAFAAGLRAILRQDPDVIMVGEMRDSETAHIGVHAALTGHLVLATLHTNDAPSAVTRLIDMGIEPFLLSSSLLGVLAQRLVRRVCPDCKAPTNADPDVLRRLGIKRLGELAGVSGAGDDPDSEAAARDALRALEPDLMIVVGSRNSSNSVRLVEVMTGTDRGSLAELIEGAAADGGFDYVGFVEGGDIMGARVPLAGLHAINDALCRRFARSTARPEPGVTAAQAFQNSGVRI